MHITNLSGSPAEHVPVIIAQIGYHIAEDFPEGHHDPSHHCHRKEQHPEDAHHSLELRDDLERETEQSSNNSRQKHPQNDEQVPPYEYHHHQGDEQTEQEELNWQFDHSPTSLTAALVDPTAIIATLTIAALTSTTLPVTTVTVTAVWILIVLNLDSRIGYRQYSSIFIMIAIMYRRPVLPTDVTELKTAFAGDVVAALIFLNDELALLALPIMQIPLKELHLFIVAFPRMHCQQTLGTEFMLTLVADHHGLICFLDDAFTVLPRTEPEVRVFGGEVELVNLFVILLDVCRQIFEEVSSHVQSSRTAIPWTHDLLETLDLIDHVVMETRLAKVKLMLALTHVNFQVLIFGFGDIRLTDLTFLYIFYRIHGVFEFVLDGVPHRRPLHIWGAHAGITGHSLEHNALESVLHEVRHSFLVATDHRDGVAGVVRVTHFFHAIIQVSASCSFDHPILHKQITSNYYMISKYKPIKQLQIRLQYSTGIIKVEASFSLISCSALHLTRPEFMLVFTSSFLLFHRCYHRQIDRTKICYLLLNFSKINSSLTQLLQLGPRGKDKDQGFTQSSSSCFQRSTFTLPESQESHRIDFSSLYCSLTRILTLATILPGPAGKMDKFNSSRAVISPLETLPISLANIEIASMFKFGQGLEV